MFSNKSGCRCAQFAVFCVWVCECVTQRQSGDEHGALWGSLWTSQGQGHSKEGDAQVKPSAGRTAHEGRQRAGWRVRQAGGGHRAAEQQIH